LKPSKNEEIDLKDIMDIDRLEKRLAMMSVILSKPSRKKLMAKLHENFGEFSEEEYPHYLIQYAIRQKVQISKFFAGNVYYTLFHKANIEVKESYIRVLRNIEEYPEFDVINQIENTTIFEENLQGFIGEIKGPVKIVVRSGYEYYVPKVFAPLTTGDATLTVIIPSCLSLQYGDILVVDGKRKRNPEELYPVSIYCLNRNVLWIRPT